MPAVMTHPKSSKQHQFPRRVKILLVDEDMRDLEYYRSALQNQGFEIRSCSSYVEGVNCLKRETFDFIVVDQGSLAFEGRVVLERVIEIDRRTPVLILTRCHHMACYLDAMQMGAVDYIEKPVTPREVAHAVQTHLPPSIAAA
jgi:DNA-binding response OmpR family regulator